MTLHYEAHITVDGGRQVQWRRHCKEWEVKPLHITMGQGVCPSQWMCTIPLDSHMSLPEHRAVITDLARKAHERGHRVIREKLEVELAPGVFYQHPTPLYYEAHTKLVIDHDDLWKAKEIAEEAGLAVSYSKLRIVPNCVKVFLTDRCYGVTPGQAIAIFEESTALIREHYFPEAKTEREAVLMDTGPGLDDGWLTIPR